MTGFESLYREFLLRLPTNLVSRGFGALSELRLPMQGRVNRIFAHFAGINLKESESPPEAYATLNAFFTRRLRAGVHSVNTEENAVVSPVDGRLAQFGSLASGVLVQAKGRDYRLEDLLASQAEGRAFSGGSYITIYLSPKDYHRIHAPFDGVVTQMSYVPGRLLPVNNFAVRSYSDLFPRNERLITYLKSPAGQRVAVVKVGATCVGRISVSYADFQSNKDKQGQAFDRTFEDGPRIGRGEEVGTFNLGSTVVLIFDHDVTLDPELKSGLSVRMGQRLGVWGQS